MASLSEHFEAIKAAIEAAEDDGYHMYIDGAGECDYEPPILNLWDPKVDRQVDFPSNLVRIA